MQKKGGEIAKIAHKSKMVNTRKLMKTRERRRYPKEIAQ
jgi:hypothetical protein